MIEASGRSAGTLEDKTSVLASTSQLVANTTYIVEGVGRVFADLVLRCFSLHVAEPSSACSQQSSTLEMAERCCCLSSMLGVEHTHIHSECSAPSCSSEDCCHGALHRGDGSNGRGLRADHKLLASFCERNPRPVGKVQRNQRVKWSTRHFPRLCQSKCWTASIGRAWGGLCRAEIVEIAELTE